MEKIIGTSGYGTLPMQVADATICSTESNYAINSGACNTAPKHDNKIKAYVDFTEFNKNYEEYLRKNGIQEFGDTTTEADCEVTPGADVKMLMAKADQDSSKEWKYLADSASNQCYEIEIIGEKMDAE